MPTHESTHQALIEFAVALQYQYISKKGICRGLTFKWIEAALLGQEAMNTFNERINLIETLPFDQLIREIEEARHQVMQHLPLTPEAHARLELLIFFDGLVLYQNPDEYFELFGEAKQQHDVDFISSFSTSKAIEKRGGLSKIHSKTDIYPNLDFLITEIHAFQEIFDAHEQNVCITISNLKHVITFYYDAQTKDWLFMNSNQWPPMKLSSPQRMKFPILFGLGHTENTILHLEVITLSNPHNVSLTSQLKIYQQKSPPHLIDPTIDQDKKYFLLHYAVISNEIETVTALLKQQLDPNHHHHGFSSTLLLACKEKNIPMVSLLLEYHADPNQFHGDDGIPLLYACDQFDMPLIEILLANHADPDQIQEDGLTALLFASDSNRIIIVEQLLAHHANPNKPLPDGKTALFCATDRGYYDIVQLLLQYNADPSLADNEGLTPLDIANESGDQKMIDLFLAHKLTRSESSEDKGLTNPGDGIQSKL